LPAGGKLCDSHGRPDFIFSQLVQQIRPLRRIGRGTDQTNRGIPLSQNKRGCHRGGGNLLITQMQVVSRPPIPAVFPRYRPPHCPGGLQLRQIQSRPATTDVVLLGTIGNPGQR